MAGRGTDIKLDAEIAAKGGLHVIGTERHESRRIDRQLAGRCARQGDPGYCQFFVSLEDEIIEAYGEKPAIRLRKRYDGQGRADQRLDATPRPLRPGPQGAPALPRPQAPDELREAAGRHAEEHGPQPRAGLRSDLASSRGLVVQSSGEIHSHDRGRAAMDIIYRYDPFQADRRPEVLDRRGGRPGPPRGEPSPRADGREGPGRGARAATRAGRS